MKSKRTNKLVFFIVFVLIIVFAFGAFFGFENYYGDTRQDYVKGVKDIRWGIDINGGVEAVFTPADKDKDFSDSDIEAAKTLLETRLTDRNITDHEVYSDTANQQIIVRFPWDKESTAFSADEAYKIVNDLGASSILVFRKGSQDPDGEIILKGAEDVKEAKPGINP